MKKVLVLLALVAAVSAYSQGTINFNNRVTTATPAISAPVSYLGDGPMAAGLIDSTRTVQSGAFTYGGVNAQVALYGGAVGTAEDSLVLLVPAVGFRSGALAGFANVGTAGSRTVDSVAPGGTGLFQVRVWDAGVAGVASYEAAQQLISATHGVYLGKSAVLTIGPLGGGSPPVTAPNLVGLTAFNTTFNIVPEPSVIGLGILGAFAGLMVFRRDRKSVV